MNIRVVNAKDLNLDSQTVKKISEVTLADDNLGYRPPNIVKESIKNGFFLVALDNSKNVLGWIEKYKIWRDWWGLSTLYVFPEYRESGVGRGTLIPAGTRDLQSKNIFAATTNKEVKPVLEKFGFKQTTLSHLPFMVKANLILLRYLNIKGLVKLLNLRTKGFTYFLKPAK